MHMSIQLVFLILLLKTLFFFLAHFENSLGPVNIRITDIQQNSHLLKKINDIEQLQTQHAREMLDSLVIAINETD